MRTIIIIIALTISLTACVVDTATATRTYSEWDQEMAQSQEATLDPIVKAEIQDIRDRVQKAFEDAVTIAGPDGTVDFGAVVAVVVKDKPEWAWLADFYNAHNVTNNRLVDGMIGAGIGVAGSAAAPWLTWLNAFRAIGMVAAGAKTKK